MSGRWVIKHGKVKKLADRPFQNGSATVEAAVALPIFLIALFTLAYVIRIFFAYSSMQSALQNVSRDISAASYYYYVSGFKEYSDKIDNLAEGASDELESQKDTMLGSIDAFNGMMASIGGAETDRQNGLDGSINNIENMCKQGLNVGDNAKKTIDLVKQVIKDPVAEGKLFVAVFAQKAAYAVRKELVCLIAGCMLDSELNRKALSGIDAKRTLGIENISFSQTQIFGDGESLEFIITYAVKPPGVFSLIPQLTLSNRVKLVAWTGGRGQSVREVKEDKKPADNSVSIWDEMDNDKKYWDRGLQIEKLQEEELRKEAGNRQMNFQNTDIMFPAVDAFIYNGNLVEAYDVFTLNPLKQTYVSNPNKIKAEIRKHGKRLMEFDSESLPADIPQVADIKRIVICIVPENSPDISGYLNAARDELLGMGISDVRLVKGYGNYDGNKDGQEKKASQRTLKNDYQQVIER